jgi:hypothetical protein
VAREEKEKQSGRSLLCSSNKEKGKQKKKKSSGFEDMNTREGRRDNFLKNIFRDFRIFFFWQMGFSNW